MWLKYLSSGGDYLKIKGKKNKLKRVILFITIVTSAYFVTHRNWTDFIKNYYKIKEKINGKSLIIEKIDIKSIEAYETMININPMYAVYEGENALSFMVINENEENKELVTEKNNESNNEKPTVTSENKENIMESMIINKDNKSLIDTCYIVDNTTSICDGLIDINEMINKDCRIKKSNEKPQILIYHTHSTEGYINSVDKVKDTVVGVGEYLTEILRNKYGYNVIHDTSSYDVIDGKWNRYSYETALKSLTKQLEDNPGIEVIIDLHRDSGNEKEVTMIDGTSVAKVMLFNGTTRNKTSFRTGLPNDNLKGNLAFSFQIKRKAMEMYPDFIKKIYLKGYRYNLHLRESSVLIEVGNDKNTIEEAKNAMPPFAKVLNEVLKQ